MSSVNPRCILVCVGSELLRGKINTHASYISRKLTSVGLALNEENTVSDALAEITEAIRRALQHFHVVIVSGGLGPTFDDLTREAASDATGRPLILSEALFKGIEAKFRRARYPMPKANQRQAFVLECADVIPNGVGTAPGQWLSVGTNQALILLPGPPNELYPMFESFVLPRLKRLPVSRAHLESHLHFVNVPESVVDDKVRPIIERHSGVDFTILAHLGLVDLDVFVSGDSAAAAEKTLHKITRALITAVGKPFYGCDADYPLEKVVGEKLHRKRQTLAVAESCTGGLLAKTLTDVAGSSDYFLQGVVTYANGAKVRELGVEKETLHKYGAVSFEVAAAMARGVRLRTGATWGISVTGIAGPGGGTAKKPVGLVYVGISTSKATIAQEFHFSGDRDAIRKRSVLAALDILRQRL
jgi:nicotinamide-nucleotide amidase